MLITEHSIPNTRSATPSRTAQIPVSSQTAPKPTLDVKPFIAGLSSLLEKAGDRQSWLLLGLVLIPVIGMIHNFMTYGFER